MRAAIRRTFVVPVIAAALLAGCNGVDGVDPVNVEAASGGRITIRLVRPGCLETLEIASPALDRTVLWRIERDPRRKGQCTRQAVFPRAPQDFRATITASRLPKGSYAVSGTARGRTLVGHFDVDGP